METVEGYLEIEVNVECPHCEEYLNLFDEDKFEHLNEEGRLHKKVLLGDRFGDDDFNEEIKCPECKKEFKVNRVWW